MMEERDDEWPAGAPVPFIGFWELKKRQVIRPTPAVEAIPPMTPFVGPEQLMRETGSGRSCDSVPTKVRSGHRPKR